MPVYSSIPFVGSQSVNHSPVPYIYTNNVQTEFLPIALSSSFVEESYNPSPKKIRRFSSVGFRENNSVKTKPKRSCSVGGEERPRLTKTNLCAHGLGFLSNEDKDERVYYG